MHRMLCKPLRKVRTVRSDDHCQNTNYSTQHGVVLWRSQNILFIRQLKFLFISSDMRKSTILTNFCNPEMPGLGRRQSRDSDERKRPESRDPGIRNPGIAISSSCSSVQFSLRRSVS